MQYLTYAAFKAGHTVLNGPGSSSGSQVLVAGPNPYCTFTVAASFPKSNITIFFSEQDPSIPRPGTFAADFPGAIEIDILP